MLYVKVFTWVAIGNELKSWVETKVGLAESKMMEILKIDVIHLN